MIFVLTSSKNSVLSSSSCCCSPALFTAASTRPPEGAGEEWAESAGRGETLSSLLTLPVLALSASSSSSLDRTTGEETPENSVSLCYFVFCFFSYLHKLHKESGVWLFWICCYMYMTLLESTSLSVLFPHSRRLFGGVMFVVYFMPALKNCLCKTCIQTYNRPSSCRRFRFDVIIWSQNTSVNLIISIYVWRQVFNAHIPTWMKTIKNVQLKWRNIQMFLISFPMQLFVTGSIYPLRFFITVYSLFWSLKMIKLNNKRPQTGSQVSD